MKLELDTVQIAQFLNSHLKLVVPISLLAVSYFLATIINPFAILMWKIVVATVFGAVGMIILVARIHKFYHPNGCSC